MICSECNNTEFKFNETLGETECVECGLVMITEPFEQEISLFDGDGNMLRSRDVLLGSKAVNKYDKTMPTHILVGKRMTVMLATSITQSRAIVERCEQAYMSCFKKGVFGRSDYEVRASALVYYVLRERNLPYSLNEICQEFGVRPNLVVKQAKAIAKHFNNPGVFSLSNNIGMVEKHAEKLGGLAFSRTCGLLYSFFERRIEEQQENFRPYTHGGIIYLGSLCDYKRITQTQVAETVGCTQRTIQQEFSRLMKMIGKNKKQIEGKGIEWIW